MTATTRDDSDHACSTCKISVILALAPLSVQNHFLVNSHILKSCAQVRTMLFDYCWAQADVAAANYVQVDLSMLSKGQLTWQRRQDKKGQGKKGKGKDNAKVTENMKKDWLVERKPQGRERHRIPGKRAQRRPSRIHDNRNAVTI